MATMRGLGLWLVVGLLGACADDGPTSLLLEVDGPASITSVDLKVALATGSSVARTLPVGVDGLTLPGKIVVELPDLATLVTIDLDAGPLHAHAEITSKVHRQVKVPLSLSGMNTLDLSMTAPADLTGVAPPDLTGVAPPDLTGVTLDLLAGPKDLAPPPPDLRSGPPVARLISNSFYTDWNGNTFELPANMSHDAFEVSTAGVVNGELLLIIANVDNGSSTLWPNPIAPGFTQLVQSFYGNDGQTYVVAWKIANNEPATYTGTYGNGKGSSSATMTLIAVSGANQTAPINYFYQQYATGSNVNPVPANNPGVTTTVDDCLLIYAAGVDWVGAVNSNTFTQPSGFTQLAALGDRGDNTWDWTSQMVGQKPHPTKGPTGAINGTLTSASSSGLGWSVVVAVAP